MAIYSFSPFGYEGALVEIEVDLRRGIPAVDIVGLADGAVKESRERMKAAIRNSGFELPSERVIISLSPADLKKEGAGFDLPVALEVLKKQSILYESLDEDVAKEMAETNVLVIGELELSGKVRPVKAIHGACETAKSVGIEYAIVPKGSDVPHGIKYCEVETLKEAFETLLNIGSDKYFKEKGEEEMEGFSTEDNVIFDDVSDDESLDRIEGHNGLKMAMAVAVAGRHNILAYGAPGCGKTMVLQRMYQLMPRMTFDEAQSVTRIYSLAGLIGQNESYIKRRPFRMPHQTASIEEICGGGPNCRPGEISLAHNGVLFLDEAAEFRSSVLQMLRVPLESHCITLSRAGRCTVYPANFQLVMAANPCPCGNYLSKDKLCLCSEKSVEQYWRKFGAPLLDRIGIRFNANEGEEIGDDYSLSNLRSRIKRAMERQYKRQGKLNQDLEPMYVLEYCRMTDGAKSLLDEITKKQGLSPREVVNITKIARTIADMLDLEESDVITERHLELALNLHGKLPEGVENCL